MKTTIDLPADLVREMKLRAVLDGRKLKETAADLIRRGLRESGGTPGDPRPRRVKVPLVQCVHRADVSPEDIARMELEGEIARHMEKPDDVA